MSSLFGRSKLFVKRNSSTILTCMGGVGVVTTSVMAVKATPKALTLLEQAKEEKGEDLTTVETVIVAGPSYIPAALVGFGTIACIFGANALNKRQQVALMSAYALLDNSYKEYRNKLKELYGEEAHESINGAIANDIYENSDIEQHENKLLFYDEFSKRYFESSMENVMRAQYELNRQLAVNSGAYLNEFYEFLGIPPTTPGTELGWSQGILEAMYWTNWVDFDMSKRVTNDGRDYYAIFMRQEPVIDFAYY